MNKLISVSILCYIILVVFILVDLGNANDHRNKLRRRRYLIFSNNTRFFLRLNWKANMVKWTQIFAQALGFRMNWDDPPDTYRPYHQLYRRAVYNHLELMLDKIALNGYHCIRRAICEMSVVDETKGVYYKILKMIFRQQSSDTDKWHTITNEECPMSIQMCPFSLLDISLYTDE